MKFVFFGTPDFAAIILEKLINAGFIPQAVVCNPDRPVGRKKIITPPPTKVLAEKHGIPVWQPEKLEFGPPAGGWELEIKKLGGIDYAIVAAYSQIIPKEILEIPQLGTIGVHPSLLPKYRGPTPIQTAILNGEKESGVTLFLMDEKIDHGPIITNIKYQSASWRTKIKNYEEVLNDLANLAADLLVETIPKFIGGELKPNPQKETEATYTKKITAQDAYVNLEKDDPELIMRKIRALNPEPGTWTIFEGKRTKIFEAELIEGKLKLKKIQFEGKKPQELK